MLATVIKSDRTSLFSMNLLHEHTVNEGVTAHGQQGNACQSTHLSSHYLCKSSTSRSRKNRCLRFQPISADSENSTTKVVLGARTQNLRPASCCARHMFSAISTFAGSKSGGDAASNLGLVLQNKFQALFYSCKINKSHVLPVTRHTALSSRHQPPRSPLIRALRHTLGGEKISATS